MIRNLREQNNFSQQKLAEILGISRQMYFKYENGEVEPPLKIIRQLSELYDVSYEYLIDSEYASAQSSFDQRMEQLQKQQFLNVADSSIVLGGRTGFGYFSSPKKSNPLSGMSFGAVIDVISKFSQKQKEKIIELLEHKQELKNKRLQILDRYAGVCEGLWSLDALEYQNSLREDR